MRADNINQISDEFYEVTKKCPHCKEKTPFLFTKDEYERLFIKNEFIHVVFPDMSNEDREVLISGTHPECWKEMFGDFDEYEDEE